MEHGSFKILGETKEEGGVGVYGRSTGSNGTPIGVKGEAQDGYGVYTVDDAKVGGELEAGSVRTERIDLGTDADLVTVGPNDDWHEVVDPIDENAHILVVGDHETRRPAHFYDDVVVEGIGDATLRKPEPFTQNLATNAAEGDTTATVTDGSQFEVGYGVLLQDDSSHPRKDATRAVIEDIQGDTLYLDTRLRGDLSTSANALCSQTWSIITNEVDDVSGENVHVRNLRFHGGGQTADGPDNWTIGLVYFWGMEGGSIKNCVMEEHHGDGISYQQALSGELSFNNIRTVNLHPIHTGKLSDGTEIRGNLCRDSRGTGLYVSEGNTNLDVINNDVIDCRGDVPGPHGSNAGGIGDFNWDNNDNSCRGNYIDLSGVDAVGIEGYGGTRGNTFHDNDVVTSGANAVYLHDVSGYTFRDNDIDVGGTSTKACFWLEENVQQTKIIDNDLSHATGGRGAINARNGGTENVTVRGNDFETPGAYPIYTHRETHTGWVLSENEVLAGSGLVWVTNDGEAVDWTIEHSDTADIDVQSSTRLVVNGWGTNDGDPSSGGQWNGNGYEGLDVYDETNGAKYTYVAADWR